MSTTSQKLSRFCKTIIAAVALPAIIATFGTTSAFAGAIFTSDLNCNKVNGNIYAAKTDVWLNGGPDGTGSALVPNSTYCVRVYSPEGTLLSPATPVCLQTTDSTGHFTCFNLFACTPFADTENPGGEYKVQVCGPITDSLDCDTAQANPRDNCKSDNFKVRASVICPSRPCISCPVGPIQVPCTQVNGSCSIVTYADPIVTDDGAGFACDHPSGSCFPVGTTTVTCTVNGTTTSCQFDVIVGACPQCELTCPTVPAKCNDAGLCTAAVNWLPPSCPETDVTVTCDHQSGDLYPVGTTTVKCKATQTGVTDPVAQCSFDITVNDCEAPTFTCPAGGDLGCNPKILPTCASLNVSASDNCPGTPTVNCGSSDSTVGCLVTRIFTITATDGINTSAPCYVTNTWTVDIDPPTISCPPDAGVQTFVPVTTDTAISLAAFVALGGAASDGTCGSVTLTYKDSGPVGDCPKVYTRTYTAKDACGNTKTCPQKITLFCPGVITDTVRCTLPAACAGTGPGIKLIFTQDSSSPGCYKLNASNPGQFYDNVFYTGPANVSVTFIVTIAYPFVTQGSNPIEVYGKPTVSTSGGKTCYVPGPKLMAGSQLITLAGYTPQSFGNVQTLTVVVPAALNNGNLWLAVHLDYGLKGTTGYNKDTGGNAIPCGSGTRTIPNNQSYSFDGAGVKTCNTFKNVTGVFGFVVNSVTTYEMPGVAAVLKDSSGKSLATGTSDQDGFYVLNYKSSKDTTVSLTITPSGYKAQTKSLLLKANAFSEVDFASP